MSSRSTQRERPVVLRRSTAMMIAANEPDERLPRLRHDDSRRHQDQNASLAHPLVQPTQSGLM